MQSECANPSTKATPARARAKSSIPDLLGCGFGSLYSFFPKLKKLQNVKGQPKHMADGQPTSVVAIRYLNMQFIKKDVCVLPRSLIRGSTLVVKFVYEAIFPSGEAMPTWASYILKLLGFLGRG